MIGNELEKLQEDLKKAESEANAASQQTENNLQFTDFIPGAPFAIPPQNIVLLWDQWFARRTIKAASTPEDLKPVKIWDVNEANRVTTTHAKPLGEKKVNL